MSVSQEIKARLDIVQYVQQYVPGLKKAGRYYKACCPFHAEKTPSFVVNPDNQSWRCFGACAEGGDIFNFAMKQHGWSFREALSELAQQAGVQLEKQTPEQQARDEYTDKLRGLLDTAADYYHRHLLSQSDEATRAVYAYAREKRGFSHETLERYQIGYAPDDFQKMRRALQDLGYTDDEIVDAGMAIRKEDTGRVYDRFRNRLMIPIRDERGRVIGFGARALSKEDNPKYLNSPQTPVFDKSKTLFGLDVAKKAIRDTGMAIIVEGYMDVIQAHQAGYLNVVAQMGTSLTESQLIKIVPRYANQIIMALDADEAGQNATRRSLEVARKALQADYAGRLSVDLRVLHIPEGKDPDDFLREAPQRWPEIIADAQPVADFVIDLETADLPRDAGLPARQAVAQQILPILTASENNLYTQDNLQKLSLKLRIGVEDLMAWAQRLQPPPQSEQRLAPVITDDQADDGLPPLPYEDELSGSAVEPPLFFDDAPHPVPTRDSARPSPAQALRRLTAQQPALTGRHTSIAAERHCLRMLLKQPDLLFQANRLLRELAQTDPTLINGPLADMNLDDFSQTEYRMIMQVLLRAIDQDELEPLEFVQAHLDQALVSDLTQLLITDVDDIHGQLGGRFGADFSQHWTTFQRKTLPGLNVPTSVVRSLVHLRNQRLKRETEELMFLSNEAESRSDTHEQLQHAQRGMLLMRARRRLADALP